MKSKKGVDYIGVSCVFYCYDKLGNLLLQKRTSSCRDEHGCWDCGGGAMRHGETFEQTVKRELKEEYCTIPLKMKMVGVNNILRTHQGIKTHWVAIIFAVQVNPKKVKIGDPESIEEIVWTKPNNLPQPLHSMYLTHLEFVKQAQII